MRIGIVANEPSGDLLGAGLIRELRSRLPEIQLEGVGGPKMIAEGFSSLYPMEKFSVMGFVEVIKHLPELLRLRRALVRHFRRNPPDLFIGVDAPDFNLGLERKLKRAGIPTVHYVSPTVWAWREGRVNKIRSAVDLILCIFPFEAEFLEKHQIPAACIGHPLADEIPLVTDRTEARERLDLGDEEPVVTLMPGSRSSEIEALGETFIRAALLLSAERPGMRFLAPMVNRTVRGRFESQLQRVAPGLPLTLIDSNSRDAMICSDVVLTASGTATLEGLLLKRPMVVAYRLNPLTHWLIKRLKLIKIPYVAMANLLAGEALAPEFIQDAATPENLSQAVLELLDSPLRVARIETVYTELHQQLRRDSSSRAAEAVLGLCGQVQ